MKRPLIAALSIGLACSSGSQKRAPRTASPRAAAVQPGLLEHVPADTPYVYAQLDPLPSAYIDGWLRDKRRAYLELRDALASLSDQRAQTLSELGVSIRLMLAIAGELGDADSREDLEALGLDSRGLFVLYGQGLWPVLRMRIRSGDRVRGTIERILERADLAIPRLEHPRAGGQTISMWHGGAELAASGFDVVVAVRERQLVVAITPAGDRRAAFLDRLFGGPPAAGSLQEAGTLAELARLYQFSAGGLGFIDSLRTAEHVAALLPGDRRVCASELRSLVAPLPRLVLGTREMSARRVRLRAVVETSPALRTALERARTAVPGLSLATLSKSGFGLGVGLDMRAFADYAAPRMGRVSERKLECSALRPAIELAASVERAFTELSTSDLRSLLGGVLIINRFDLSQGPSGLAASVLLGTREPDKALDVLSDIVPELKRVTPAPGGEPVEVQLSSFGVGGVYLAMGRSALGASIGGRSQAAALSRLVGHDPAGGLPLFVVHSTGKLWNDLNRLRSPRAGDGASDLASAMSNLERVTYESVSAVGTVERQGIVIDVALTYPE